MELHDFDKLLINKSFETNRCIINSIWRILIQNEILEMLNEGRLEKGTFGPYVIFT